MTRPKSGSMNALSMVNPGAAAVDIGSTMHMAAVNPNADGDLVQSFGTFTGDLHAIARWFKTCGDTSVAMESTGVYWIPAYEVLEEHGFRDPRQRPLRQECAGPQNRCERRRLATTPSQLWSTARQLSPGRRCATLRAYLRQRERLIEYCASHIQHMQKALMEMNVQLHHVVTNITGVTGMRIIRAIVSGEPVPDTLAAMRDIRCHASAEKICAALPGTWRDEHIFALEQALALYDFYQTKILDCDRKLLLIAQAHPATHLQNTRRSPAGRVRLYQDVLQPDL